MPVIGQVPHELSFISGPTFEEEEEATPGTALFKSLFRHCRSNQTPEPHFEYMHRELRHPTQQSNQNATPQIYMAALVGHGYCGNSKNFDSEACSFADLLDSYRISHCKDREGELPLMKDVFVWKEACCSPYAKASVVPASSNLKQVLHAEVVGASNYPKSERRLCVAEERMKAVAFGLGARHNRSLHKVSGLPEGKDLSRLMVGGILQASESRMPKPKGACRSEHASPSKANFFCEHRENMSDDEFSLHHWVNFGCNRKDARRSKHQGERMISDARGLRSSNLTRVRRDLLCDPHVCEILHEGGRKQRKFSTSRDSCKLAPQSLESFRPSSSNTYCTYLSSHSHSSPSLSIKQPRLGQQEFASTSVKSEAHIKHDWLEHGFEQLLQPSMEHSELQRLLAESVRARLHLLQEVKVPVCDDELDVSELPRGGRGMRWQRSFHKARWKTLLKNSRKCSLARCAYKGTVRAETQGKSKPKCMRDNKKDAEAVSDSGTVSLACSRNSQTLCVEGTVKAASNRRKSKKGLGKSNCEKEAKDGLSKFSSTFRCLSQKYRPKFLQDLIGQSFVAHVLSQAISKDRIAPVYLFQGSHGTGKTSAARIFARAINCVTSGENKPCGLCGECTALTSGKVSCVWELDAVSYDGIGRMHELIESIDFTAPSPRYKVVIIDECHMFSLQTWNALMKLFEEPPVNAVFILVTTESEKLPPCVVSRCQRFHFLRIKHCDIVARLDRIAKLENILAEPGALNLIASKSDGSLRNAETVLDQVSLLEQRITPATIHKLVGSIADDNLMSLLDLALCSDTVSIVQKTREIIDLGVEPLDLISQLATLITDILAGTYVPMETNRQDECSFMHALSDVEMQRLRTALHILSEAERQVRAVSLYRATWLTAAMLQLGSRLQCKSKTTASRKSLAKASPVTKSSLRRAKGTKQREDFKGEGDLKGNVSMEAVLGKKSHGLDAAATDSSTEVQLEPMVNPTNHSGLPRESLSSLEGRSLVENEGICIHLKSPSNFGNLWLNVLNCCRPISLRHLLQNHGRLLTLSISAVNIVAHVVFEKPPEKVTAEMYRLCITESFREVLGPFVEVQFSLASDLCPPPLDLCKVGIASSPTARNGASCSQSSTHCEDNRLRNEKGSLDVRSSRSEIEDSQTQCGARTVIPMANAHTLMANRRPMMDSAHALMANRCSPMVNGCPPPMQLSANGSLDTSLDPLFKKQARTNRWRLMVGLHAKRYLCDCVHVLEEC